MDNYDQLLEEFRTSSHLWKRRIIKNYGYGYFAIGSYMLIIAFHVPHDIDSFVYHSNGKGGERTYLGDKPPDLETLLDESRTVPMIKDGYNLDLDFVEDIADPNIYKRVVMCEPFIHDQSTTTGYLAELNGKDIENCYIEYLVYPGIPPIKTHSYYPLKEKPYVEDPSILGDIKEEDRRNNVKLYMIDLRR